MFVTAWAHFVVFVHNIPFIHYGLAMNEGIWIHLIGAAILAKLLHAKFSFWKTVLIVFAIAVAWEIIEYFLEASTTAAMLDVYGSVTRYAYDTLADIAGAVLITVIANLDLRKNAQK